MDENKKNGVFRGAKTVADKKINIYNKVREIANFKFSDEEIELSKKVIEDSPYLYGENLNSVGPQGHEPGTSTSPARPIDELTLARNYLTSREKICTDHGLPIDSNAETILNKLQEWGEPDAFGGGGKSKKRRKSKKHKSKRRKSKRRKSKRRKTRRKKR